MYACTMSVDKKKADVLRKTQYTTTYSPNDTIAIENKDIHLIQELLLGFTQFEHVGVELGGRSMKGALGWSKSGSRTSGPQQRSNASESHDEKVVG